MKKDKAKKYIQNNMFIYFFVVPIALSLIFTKVFDIDISNLAIENTGLFSFLDKAGMDVNTKAMAALTYLAFIPALWKYFKSLPRREDNLKMFSILKLYAVIIFLILMLYTLVRLVFYEIPYNPNGYQPRLLRSILIFSRSDLLFSVLWGVLTFSFVFFMNATIVFISELIKRIKNIFA